MSQALLLEAPRLPLLEAEAARACDCNRTPCQCGFVPIDPAWAPPLLGLDDAPAWEPLTDEEAAGIARRASALKAEADCIRANAKALVEDLEGRLEWLLTAEEQRLREWIARGKPGAKSRRCMWGSFTTRSVPGRVSVDDLQVALDWCREWLPEAVVMGVDCKHISVLPELDPATGEVSSVVPPGFSVSAERNVLGIQPLPRGGKGEAE